MARTLLVTNDFPPRTGGIQNYLHAMVSRLPAGEVVVYAPEWPGAAQFDAAQPFPVHRHRGSLMLPEPGVARTAAALAREHSATTVWFGAAAPLALLGPTLRRRTGIERVVASTHGHEVGWSMLPAARQALRRIGRDSDVVTTISRYTRGRVAAAFGPAAALELLPSGIDTAVFRPDGAARAELRRRYRIGAAPLITCVSRLVARKGQDSLIRALPQVRSRVPGTHLLVVGDGPAGPGLLRLAAQLGVGDAVTFTGPVPEAELPAHHAVGDVFALPCRTRGRGLDVEGLGIVLLEAAAAGLPVVAGDSGGAPETVLAGRTGHVVGGCDGPALVTALAGLLADPDRAAAMGAAGRVRMQQDWSWDAVLARLRPLLAG
ncbi:glycosyltransferase family 4 protein [Pseudonocardia sp. GCM10023141]|uniref:glycosyltransferase family 4 protein n=1 Tax=Pseudonocardia sp. GCM10023141 TaxID=3252653 RepID=UPI003622A39A